MKQLGIVAAPILLSLAMIGESGCSGGQAVSAIEAEPAIEFKDVLSQTRTFIRYYETIELTPEQKKVKEDALIGMRAACCSGSTMLECCCPCNLSKTIWGLSHYLIARQGYDAEQVKQTVLEWIRFVNPAGFDGQTCYTQRCNTPFAAGGCGGMRTEQLVF